MKKIISLLIIFLYSIISVNPCFALSKLYYLENTKKENISYKIISALTERSYTIKKEDPYYAVSTEDPGEYAVIILQQNGNNLYYYLDTNTGSKKLNKTILKNLKKMDIEYEEIENPSMISTMSETAEKIRTGKKSEYNFDVDTTTYNNTKQTVTKSEQTPPTTMKGYIGKTGKGDTLDVYLQTAINTATVREGDKVTGVLNADWKTKENLIIAKKGSLLNGDITDCASARFGMRNGFAKISFYEIITPEGKSYNITTKPVEFNVTNEGKAEQVITQVLTNALIGAGVGLLLGLISGNGEDMLKGAAIGAGVSGVSTMAVEAAEAGVDAEIPVYTPIEVTISKDINVVLSY